MNSSQRLRARFVLGCISVAAGILAISLYWIQIVNGQSYADKADRQYERPSTSLFDRGSIFFTSKDGTRVSAATIARGYVIYMDPTKIVDAESAYQALIQYLPLKKELFLRQASKTGDRYEKLADKISEETTISIQELGLPGIGASKQNWRSYPGAQLSAHVLGIIGESPDGSIEGRYGLERSYENVLRRVSLGSSVNVFAQIFTGLRDSVFGEGERIPGDIITTIEPTVEGYVEVILANIQAEWKPDSIGAIIMDPRTGEIIAMSSLPTFNAQNLSHITNVSVLSNPLVEHVYEMGSIMKPLTMAIGLDSGVITPKSTYNDTGTMTLDQKKISNYDGRARGVIPMQEILSQSLNVGAATIALKVGSKKFTEYFNSFGFGVKTGIDQPNEVLGLLNNLDSALDIEIATAAYGQGVAVSPIAMIRALALLANDGYSVRPHLVKRIEYENGRVETISTDTQGPILGKKAVEDTTKMLVEAVDTALQKGGIKFEHYSVAAKTGTAQIANPNNRGYYSDRYLHSFFGYFPAYDPQFIVFLYQIHPKGAQYASETLTKPFAEITKFLITYYNIAPDR